MTDKADAISFYNDPQQAERYGRQGGFAAARTAGMRRVLVDLISALVPDQAAILELGAGSGRLTEMLAGTGRFRTIFVSDGAAAMLAQARRRLAESSGQLEYLLLDFSAPWPATLAGLEAVISSMALHHAADKETLFRRVRAALRPGGYFIFGDHMAGETAGAQALIDRERALQALRGREPVTPARIKECIAHDRALRAREGDRCESVPRTLQLLAGAGFADVACLWRDYWLAVFIGRAAD